MSLRMKLTVGLGFLFVIIFALSIYSSYDIHRSPRMRIGSCGTIMILLSTATICSSLWMTCGPM